MVQLDHPLHVPEDSGFRLDDVIGWQSTFALATAHAAPGGNEPNTNLLRSSNLVIQSHIVGVKVEMIHSSCAT